MNIYTILFSPTINELQLTLSYTLNSYAVAVRGKGVQNHDSHGICKWYIYIYIYITIHSPDRWKNYRPLTLLLLYNSI